MKDSGACRDWVRKEYDPEYTSSRDLSPKRSCLNRVSHASDRCRTALRTVWMTSESDTMCALIDGGFVNDVCLDQRGVEVPCGGVLLVH